MLASIGFLHLSHEYNFYFFTSTKKDCNPDKAVCRSLFAKCIRYHSIPKLAIDIYRKEGVMKYWNKA